MVTPNVLDERGSDTVIWMKRKWDWGSSWSYMCAKHVFCMDCVSRGEAQGATNVATAYHTTQRNLTPTYCNPDHIFFPLSAFAFKNRIMELLKVKGSMKRNDPTSSFDEYILWRNSNKLTPTERLLNARPCSKWFTVGISFSFHNTIIGKCYYCLYF